jgi:arginine/ornithine N-succinyltransferase beta subunit
MPQRNRSELSELARGNQRPLVAVHRSGLNGRLLSKARFLFLAEFRQRFGDKVIAEMRGYSDEEGAHLSGKVWDVTSSRWILSMPTTSQGWATRPSSLN